ncbi:E3 ubiquitin/ISG15 ligase TRIM25-like [Bufo gargarizans]|uniref:E3 ubiquitin/ISG15 ligase TRIM25-like n=1 Tax=Bufo gargarizans TaxID=30331 RepID=UPI001CF1DF8F|nr:E3 ubiquitin/ISG15 ligase TRIM25-like [Bufo gargarizans]
MASADLRAELDCSICLSLYTDPVSLRCGHNFCRSCIVSALDAQEAAGVYSCPDCRAEYPERPALEKSRKLRNIVERFLSAQPDMEETEIFCTYCTKSPVPAVRTCLHCEASFCEKHLSRHSKSSEHTLVEPTATPKERKCSTHKEVLKYYCPMDAACICVSCWVAGDHKGHDVQLLDVASEKEKEKLRKYLEELNPQKAEIQSKLQNLQDRQRNIQEKASDKRKNVRKLFMDIKEQLEMAEKKALSEISRKEEKIVSQISDLIKKLEIEEDELFRKMRHVEEMCHVTDPIRLLQESDITVCGHGDDEDTGEDGREGRSEDDLDEVLISLTFYRSMRDIVTNVTSELGLHVPDILLDEDTANIYVKISEDLKTATTTEEEEEEEEEDRPESPGRFLDYPQVLSRCGLSSGKHYWEVEWDQKGKCDIGLSYPSIEREGDESCIGCNDKSWSLDMSGAGCTVCHRSVRSPLSVDTTCPRLGVFLDYEAGRLSFCQLCDPIRHLHTFTASFSEPLHVVFWLWSGASVRIIKMAEKKALSEISRQEEKIVSQISDLIKKLEIEEDELSGKMRHVEEMCHVTDPIRLLQESDITVCGHGDDENTGGDGGEGRSEDDLDEVLISLTLHRSMRDIVTNVTSELGLDVPDILLDEDTANEYVKISEDLKTATEEEDEEEEEDEKKEQDRPESPGRFLYWDQVLSRCGLSSGRHYWEVEWNQIGGCDIGLSYPSIERKGQRSGIRCNDKSWCLEMSGAGCAVCHRSVTSPLSLDTTCPRLGVYLDYEARRLSFYKLCDPIRHLHTFTASFSEPLHAVFCVKDGASVRIIS